MQVIGSAAMRRLLDSSGLIGALGEIFRDGGEVPARLSVQCCGDPGNARSPVDRTVEANRYRLKLPAHSRKMQKLGSRVLSYANRSRS